jgi:hypothetical protein
MNTALAKAVRRLISCIERTGSVEMVNRKKACTGRPNKNEGFERITPSKFTGCPFEYDESSKTGAEAPVDVKNHIIKRILL